MGRITIHQEAVMPSFRTRLPLFVAVVGSLLAASPGPVRATAAASSSVVHLGHGSDDVHAVSMALGIATAMAKRPGAKLTLFLDREGVRIADRRTPGNLRYGHSKTLVELYDAFVAAGGEVLVCSHCAEAIGLTADQLRQGARIGSDEEVANRLLAADRILDY
jgi:predicted peroxiredoxin